MIDPREKGRLFEVTIEENDWWLNIIARNNAPINSCEDLEQEIRMAFWKSLGFYDGEIPDLGKRFFSVAINTVKLFIRKNSRMKKWEEGLDPSPYLVEPERDLVGIVEEFSNKLGELDRLIFTMYFDNLSYTEISAALGVNEVNLRQRMSRIKKRFKTIY
jgi:RNA polymerase sigma factor (sigma-70 family)